MTHFFKWGFFGQQFLSVTGNPLGVIIRYVVFVVLFFVVAVFIETLFEEQNIGAGLLAILIYVLMLGLYPTIVAVAIKEFFKVLFSGVSETDTSKEEQSPAPSEEELATSGEEEEHSPTASVTLEEYEPWEDPRRVEDEVEKRFPSLITVEFDGWDHFVWRYGMPLGNSCIYSDDEGNLYEVCADGNVKECIGTKTGRRRHY